MTAAMRVLPALLGVVITACGTDVRPQQDTQPSSDPGVDGGLQTDGGSEAAPADARVPPPDGIPSDLAPCDEAVYHSDFTFVQEEVFTVSCATSGCHDSNTPAGGMDLTAGRAHANLVNVASSDYTGWMRVVPNDSAASMLMVQVGGEPGPALEGLMPWGEPELCAPLVDAMRRWIAAGALQD